ncbi:MAG: metallophosphoesterase family protein [Bacteroidales bacterium]
MSAYIISDIHGCAKTLRSLIECRLRISTNDQLYFLGDYIDRGPDSAGVVDYILELKDSGFTIDCLMGNHEHMLLNSVLSKSNMDLWMVNGGMATLLSYGIQSSHGLNIFTAIPAAHLEFFKSLNPYIFVSNRFLLVHGGINHRSKKPLADIASMLWSRTSASSIPDDFLPGYTIIHGHTPEPIDTIIENVQSRSSRLLGLDAGCVFKGFFPGTGYLTALNLDKWELHFVKCID